MRLTLPVMAAKIPSVISADELRYLLHGAAKRRKRRCTVFGRSAPGTARSDSKLHFAFYCHADVSVRAIERHYAIVNL